MGEGGGFGQCSGYLVYGKESRLDEWTIGWDLNLDDEESVVWTLRTNRPLGKRSPGALGFLFFRFPQRRFLISCCRR